MNIHQFEDRKQISTGEQAVEILPTIGIKCLNRGVVIDDGDIIHTREAREAAERFFPKPSVGLAYLWPDSQRL